MFSDQFLKSHLPTEADEQIVYKGEFIVTRGDFIPIASDASGLSFVQTEKANQEKELFFCTLKLSFQISS